MTEMTRCFLLFRVPPLALAASAWILSAQVGVQPGPPTVAAQPAVAIPNLSTSQIQGSVMSDQAPGPSFALTLKDAIGRGLKANLGILVRETGSQTARAARMRALSALKPNVTGAVSQTSQQTNLDALGINIPIPGFSKIVGPFGFFDARASASWTIADWVAWSNLKSAREGQRAAELSAQDARDLVVQAVANAYFQIIASAARIESIAAQVATAQALYNQAVDQKSAGTSPGIDVLRAQVELQSDQQQLLAQKNQFEKDKLGLARAIGLAPGQEFTLADKPGFTALAQWPPEEALKRAYATRADYQSGLAQVKAAEEAKKAVRYERFPTLSVNGAYGDIGRTVDSSHGTYSVTGAVKFNIFDGGRIKAEDEQAAAALKQRQDELGDLRGKINFEVRTSLLDLNSTAEQVRVAESNRDLAQQTLGQAHDRFKAGVTNNVEVVQAQQQVAAADQTYISALFAHNLAKVSLARALGKADSALSELLGGTK